jgi:hypothetical protein
MRALITAWLLASWASLAAANPAMEGQWMLEIRPDGAPVIGLLEVERDGQAWRAFVEGGPAPIVVDGDRIAIDIDSRDLRGFIFIVKLEGTIAGDTLSGVYTVESDAEVPFTPGTWSAERYVPAPRPDAPAPVDISGIWKPAPGVDIRKYSMTLTPKAQAWHDGYLMHYDQPNVRCISPGIVAMVAWGGYPFEVLESDQRLTFLYEVDSEVRRIFLDGREPPPYYPGSGMGFSTGRWEGSALVIETTNLAPNVRDFRGEPISENARMEEVYTVSEDGQRLSAVITLHDPENYERPPVRRRAWVRDAHTEIYPYECDPDSFYRQMYNEGRLDMYFERSKRRM